MSFSRILVFFLAMFSLHGEDLYAKNIVIFGAGYVGSVMGGCFSKFGHQITFIEPCREKVAAINSKKSPILEDQLGSLIATGVERGLVSARGELGDELQVADIAIITVATPTLADGSVDISTLEAVLKLISSSKIEREPPLVVCICSTILPHHFRELEEKYIRPYPGLNLVVSPEFMRESTAVQDFLSPPFCIVGGNDLGSVKQVLALYDDCNTDNKLATTAESACLLKYACNAFHALKIAFANEIASICDDIDIPARSLLSIFVEDRKLNCSSAYLKPGFAFGGSCLAKDVEALTNFCKGQLARPVPVISAILPSNKLRFEKALKEILEHNHHTLAIVGMTFKKNSDDLRSSPYVELIEQIQRHAINVQIYDPDIAIENIVSTHSQRYMHQIPYIKGTLLQALAGCDGVVLCKDLLDGEAIKEINSQNITIYNLGYYEGVE